MSDTEEVVKGIMVVCFFTGVFFVIPTWACIASLSNEINAQEYQKVREWVENYPELHSFEDECMDDDCIISYSEYNNIKEKMTEIDRKAHSDSVRQACKNACENVCSEVKE